MVFRDVEPPPANSSAGPKPIHQVGDRVRLVAHSNDKAPLEENRQQVLLEVIDTSSTSERSGLDLVAVLDVSGSMEGSKLDKLKTAMKFVISKLGPMDRLSIVSFSDKASRRCPLCFMTGAFQEEVKDIVEKGLEADSSTNMRDGLETGHRVLAERQHSSGRVSSIVLMSDGQENSPGASKDVDVSDTAVYTFGFGEDHDAVIAREHRDKFGDWLVRHMMHAQTECAELRLVAQGPSTTILTFQGYDINGYTFYTRAQDNKRTNQNSGVRIDAYDSNGNRQTYYGFIEEIWEFDYGASKVPLFLCQWVRLPRGVNIDKYDVTTMDLKHIGFREEPFMLAHAVTQIFFVTDPANKDRPVVLEGKRRIVGVEDVVDEEDYNQFDDLPPFGENVDLSLMKDGEEGAYICRDHNEGRVVA